MVFHLSAANNRFIVSPIQPILGPFMFQNPFFQQKSCAWRSAKKTKNKQQPIFLKHIRVPGTKDHLFHKIPIFT